MMNGIVIKHHHVLIQLKVSPVVLPSDCFVTNVGRVGVEVDGELEECVPFWLQL